MKNQLTLFYDLETSGLIKDYHLPSEDPSHPHITQIAAILRDGNGQVLERTNRYIKPEGWTLDSGILAFNARVGNGITQERLEYEGVPVWDAMAEFFKLLRQCDFVVQWDSKFLGRMIRIDSKRQGMEAEADAFKVHPSLSLNKAVTNVCAIPRAKGGGYKAPNMPEAHQFLLGIPMLVTNNADSDVDALVRIFDAARDAPGFAWPFAGEGEDA